MAAVTVSPKYQVVIPKDVRERMGIRPGQRVEVLEYDGRIELVPVESVRRLRGSLPGLNTDVPREEDRL